MNFDVIGLNVERKFIGCTFSTRSQTTNILMSKLGLPGDKWEENCIYLITEDLRTANIPSFEGANIICAREYISPENALCCNVILVPSRELFIPVYNHVQALLAKENELSSLSRYVLTSNVPLQHVVDLCAEKLGNPIVVTDLGKNILAMSAFPPGMSLERYKELGYLPFDGKNQISSPAIFEGNENAAHIDDDGQKEYVMRTPLHMGDAVIGYITVHSHFKEFEMEDIHTLETVAGLVSLVLMRQSPASCGLRTAKDYFISDLVRGALTDSEEIESRLRFMDWQLKKYVYLLLVRWEGNVRNVEMLESYVSALSRLLPEGRYSIIDGDMVAIFSLDTEVDAKSKLHQTLEEHLAREGARGIISSSFTSLSEVASQYRQARTIFDINLKIKRVEHLYRSEDGVLELMLHTVGKEHNLYDLCHPLIRKLIRYDHEHKTDFTKYLRAYICSGRNFTSAAAKLYTHRNTVIYRISRINELLDFDFRSQDTVFCFELSFCILNYLDALEGRSRIGE
jgi:hypothetical protein